MHELVGQARGRLESTVLSPEPRLRGRRHQPVLQKSRFTLEAWRHRSERSGRRIPTATPRRRRTPNTIVSPTVPALAGMRAMGSREFAFARRIAFTTRGAGVLAALSS